MLPAEKLSVSAAGLAWSCGLNEIGVLWLDVENVFHVGYPFGWLVIMFYYNMIVS